MNELHLRYDIIGSTAVAVTGATRRAGNGSAAFFFTG